MIILGAVAFDSVAAITTSEWATSTTPKTE